MITANNKSWIDALRRSERLPENYTTTVFDYIAPLAERIRSLHTFLGHPAVVGISGAQGSGKSTFALFLTNWLQRELGLAAVNLSLDDFYLSKHEREDLAEKRHPLLRTRGVPGTHDIVLGTKTLAALTEPGAERVVTLPGFDKARDDRVESSRSRCVEAPVDIVLFEGWCVGARPQKDWDLADPANELEAKEDADGAWRAYVNEQLKSQYAALFGHIDVLVMLRVPSFDKVLEWRELQERKLREDAKRQESGQAAIAGMNPAEVRRFVMYFERLTRHMLEDMPSYADTVIDIDKSHRMVAVAHRSG
ncbi:MAG: hypothetical protein OEU90_05145 [Gammaproteobacteria bacterium]|nr:hypothetical protein [Gammaproteobacteria bacterium]MDH3751413.1 hypothetical protein [Gammaproteobacteria bacterium]MDH3804846.1 hypothetical protein [Gammaproteobacteria bacterium]